MAFYWKRSHSAWKATQARGLHPASRLCWRTGSWCSPGSWWTIYAPQMCRQKAVGKTGTAALWGVASGVAAFSSHRPCLAAPGAGKANECWVKKPSTKKPVKTNPSNGLCFSSLWNKVLKMKKGKQNKVLEEAFARQKVLSISECFAGWGVPLLTRRCVRYILVLFSQVLAF